ncbi:MAG: hypothetical protein L0Z53_03410, partial [Acidobacteriales bacterium]|nr:hypothetical protein [Terriglobales bacterium]
MALRSRALASRVLEQCRYSLEHPSAFTAVASEFGMALGRHGHALRNLRNDRKMSDRDLDPSEPHVLSEVLSGALYTMLVKIYASVLQEGIEQKQSKAVSRAEVMQVYGEPVVSSGSRDPDSARRAAAPKALFIASERFKRTIIRALDYLPPADVTFADYARAILASDEASHPDSGEQRQWLIDEFKRRDIARSKSSLEVETNFEHKAVSTLDLDELVTSEWVAYQFAERNRSLLKIPKGVPFEVRPRLDVTKLYYHQGEGKITARECLLKVSWTEAEPNEAGQGLPKKRRITRGTTLAIDWATKKVRALLTSEPAEQSQAGRDHFVRRLWEARELRLDEEALGPDGKPLLGVVQGRIQQQTLRVLG